MTSVKILELYDNEKMIIDVNQQILYVWYDSCEEYEEWFSLKYEGKETLLNNFFGKIIDLKFLMSELDVGISYRYYDNYSTFKAANIKPNQHTHQFPLEESFYTGIDFKL